MKKEKDELLRLGIDNYTKQDMVKNPIFYVEAIGYLKACKIIMPESEQEIDKLIELYMILIISLTL